MIDSSHVESLLKFLDIPRKHWHVAIEKIELASVQAFHFLHRVRFGGPLERVQLDMDPNGICNTSEDDISIRGSTRPPARTSVELTPTLTRMNMSDFTKK
jgi:hypothetical protein